MGKGLGNREKMRGALGRSLRGRVQALRARLEREHFGWFWGGLASGLGFREAGPVDINMGSVPTH